MKVEDAKKLECPHFQFVVNEEAVVRGGNTGPIVVHQNCRADGCIMWRQTYNMVRDIGSLDVNTMNMYPTIGEPRPYAIKVEGDGFCGLAGKEVQL